MPNLTNKLYALTNNKQQKTNVYIETGAYLGEGIKTVLNSYDTIYSIELSEKWFHYNVEQFKNNSNVHMILGDSKKILPELIKNIHEPVTVYLDAHYSGGTTSFGEEETPLLHELSILKNRTYDDIIIIDDGRLLGKTGTCGCGPNHPIYPTMTFNWVDITETKIKDLMKPNYILLKNDNQMFSDGATDQFILVKR